MSCQLAHFKVVNEDADGLYEYILTYLFTAGDGEYEYSFVKDYYYTTTEKPDTLEDIRVLATKHHYDDICYQRNKALERSNDIRLSFGIDKDILL